jgi:hypothetical protein
LRRNGVAACGRTKRIRGAFQRIETDLETLKMKLATADGIVALSSPVG